MEQVQFIKLNFSLEEGICDEMEVYFFEEKYW